MYSKNYTTEIECECDGSGPCHGTETRRVPTGGDGGAILCRACYGAEMRWRRERNKDIINPVCHPFKTPEWNVLRVVWSK